MAKCFSCSAPLPANSQYCRYCGVRNDIDLQGKHTFQAVQEAQTERWCPQCRIPLQSIALAFDKPLIIERCEHCFGLFFDPGEIEALLDHALSPVTSINLDLLDNINRERYRGEQGFKYLKCPVCDVMMNRVAFGHKSGVVVDHCKSHGIWLEGGEVSHLLEWKKAGGQLLDDKKRLETQTAKNSRNTQAEIETLLQTRRMPTDDSQVLSNIAEILFTLFE